MRIFCKKLIAVAALSAVLAITFGGGAFGAVSPEEAAKLGGPVLTVFGAERAGNKEGTIPEYTGGLTKTPANIQYDPKSGLGRPDPFPSEKPLFSINAQNMDQYASKLSEGTKVMMKKYPSYRIDIYPTHRTVAYPKFVLDHTLINAVKASTYNGGLSVKNAFGGFPFPIPKDGYEIMWNHLLRYEGVHKMVRTNNWTVDINGRSSLTSIAMCGQEYPYYDMTLKSADYFYYVRCDNIEPPRDAGGILLIKYPLNLAEKGAQAWQYLPGLRRVKLAPELTFDTPNSLSGGVETFDDLFNFSGSLERYNWKFIEKKEMYIPYNDYKVNLAKREDLMKIHHINPDFVRWELHRVWVVEATLRPGMRHTYHKRRFYVDEDSWAASLNESYDARGTLYRYGVLMQIPSYDIPAPLGLVHFQYDLYAGNYCVNPWMGGSGFNKVTAKESDLYWSAQGMTGSGVR